MFIGSSFEYNELHITHENGNDVIIEKKPILNSTTLKIGETENKIY